MEPGRKFILSFKTASADQTKKLGRILGEKLASGMVIALIGDLGTGKTVFAKGVTAGLGLRNEKEVTSPSFVVINEYQGRMPVWHVDLYRLKNSGEVEDLGWEELMSPPGVTMVEWAEKALALFPEDRIEVHLEWVNEMERKLLFIGRGEKARELVEGLGENWKEEG